MVKAVVGDRRLDQTITIAYQEHVPARVADPTPVVLLHGSPGRAGDFGALAPALAERYRLIVPDLPGFGRSAREIPDYSIRAHARYVLQLLDELRVERAHVLGYSMGGGVALNLADLAPDRVASITMLSAIGVQELELLGDYHLNHLLHGLQLAALWLAREGLPHMGWLDGAVLGVPYARNFFDSDQRPLRQVLTRYEGPMLIVHGREDGLVPAPAALEHHRLVPQSELRLIDDGHLMVFTDGRRLAPLVGEFFNQVNLGRAATRAAADPARVAQASLPFDPASAPKASGITAVVVLGLIAGATLVSEDLTCVGAGIMAAQGRISFLLAAFACFLGIYVGDLLLFLAGRYLGRPALHRAPLKWFLRPEAVERSSAWFRRRGGVVIFASRFLPGARLPTYFAAGLLNTSFWRFALYFALAVAVWAPLLVGLAMALGGEVVKSALLAKQSSLIKLFAAGAAVLLLSKLALALASFRGRRLLLSAWRRKVRWEFWPPWLFYPPVIGYVLCLALKHRSLTLFTAANPAIPAGGFVGESKADILQGLAGAAGYVARAMLIAPCADLLTRVGQARTFMAQNSLDYPVVLKPDAGQRGAGVAVIRSEGELATYLRRAPGPTIIQEYVAGAEFGVFYYRYPDQEKGQIFSVTDKRFPVVVGDGTSTLEQLILKDKRAVCMARFYLGKQKDRLWDTPAPGEPVQLVELGTHCRGAIFLDGAAVKTPALEEAIDRVSRSFAGFYFGRFDIRTPSVEDFKQGKNFKVIELNGVTSEATHIYDPANGLLTAYQTLCQQWRIAFEIGAQNRARGVQPTPVRTLVRLLAEYRRAAPPEAVDAADQAAEGGAESLISSCPPAQP